MKSANVDNEVQADEDQLITPDDKLDSPMSENKNSQEGAISVRQEPETDFTQNAKENEPPQELTQEQVINKFGEMVDGLTD